MRGKALFGLLLLGGIWNREVVSPGISPFHFPVMDYCPEIIGLHCFPSLKIMHADHTFSLIKIPLLFALSLRVVVFFIIEMVTYLFFILHPPTDLSFLFL